MPDPADFLCCGHRVGTGPLIDPVDAGGQPLAGAQQVVEIAGQVRKVGDVGAEVVAAGAAEPDRAGTPSGLDVGRLGAGPVGDGDRPDGVAGALAVEQGQGIPPDPVAVPVELHRGHLVDGFAATGLADAVVPFGRVHRLVVHQLAEHVDADPGVSVPLRVGVPVGIRSDEGLVVFRAVGPQQRPH